MEKASSLPGEFTAFRVDVDGKAAKHGLMQLPIDSLPANEVVVRVLYSSLNYKDALSASGNRGVTRNYPHTPGIDAAGLVVVSTSDRFAPGDPVICTGYDLGMDTPGGFGQFISVPAEWLVPLPAGLTLREAMAIGTAGVTAALALNSLEAADITPRLGPIVVTGASGGVGCLSVALLAGAGYEVVASSGKPEATQLLRDLGATRVVARQELLVELSGGSDRPLLSAAIAGAVDTVGGATLGVLVRSCCVGGAVAACGLVGGTELDLSVFPFILRGVSLLGVSSQHAQRAERLRAWARLAACDSVRTAVSDARLVREIGLAQLPDAIQQILAGRVLGRTVIAL